jgi:hypothetical protein
VADARSEGHDCSLEHLLSLVVMIQDQLSTHIRHRPCTCVCQCLGCPPPRVPTPAVIAVVARRDFSLDSFLFISYSQLMLFRYLILSLETTLISFIPPLSHQRRQDTG